MNIHSLFYIWIFFLMIVGCDKTMMTRSQVVESHSNMVKKAYQDPSFFIAKNLKDNFNAVGSIGNFNSKNGPKNWMTVFILDGRYEVTYIAPIEIVGDKISLVSEGSLHVNEITRVVSPREIHCEGFKKVFSSDEILSLKENEWKFEKFGIPVKEPIAGVEGYFEDYRSLFTEP